VGGKVAMDKKSCHIRSIKLTHFQELINVTTLASFQIYLQGFLCNGNSCYIHINIQMFWIAAAQSGIIIELIKFRDIKLIYVVNKRNGVNAA
jgi:hypothetical protein